MSAELFFEIGTEEIPAGFLTVARKDLEKLFRKELEAAHIAFGSIHTFATPRRLAIAIENVAIEQEKQELNVSGPPAKIAFDADGNPTKAAIGFAKTNGVEISDLQQKETPKGIYLFIHKVIEGQPVANILPEMLPRILNTLPFKKSMRWKDLDIRFARPVHWLVALFNGQVIPFSFGNLESGNLSRGHRFMAPEVFPVTDVKNYIEEAEKHFVIPDPEKRKEIIAGEIRQIAEQLGGSLNVDEELLDEVAHLVEFPSAVCGSFEEKYLELPVELLITTMKEHQRYFTVSGTDGRLLPHFITVANTRAEDPDVVRRGNERVIRARLADAMFFWKEDQKSRLEKRLDALKNVVFQAKLGTSFEKVMRFRDLALGLARQFAPQSVEFVDRAALLAKCDLETQMVYEFPELQGIMGREYALLQGEPPEVAKAIYEHYLPVQAGGDLPSDAIGSVLSIADKIDTICGCFGVGLIPTGTADPFALRRSAIGILNIALENGLALSLQSLVGHSLTLLKEKLTRPQEEVANDVIEFIRQRFFHLLTSQGFAQDVVNAVLSAAFDEPLDAFKRVEALAAIREKEDFEPLAIAFKRVMNIIKGGVPDEVNAELFTSDAEELLNDAVATTATKVRPLKEAGDYGDALENIAAMRGPVDRFFEDVLVMDEDPRVRTNRLALLTSVAGLFEGIADFSKIAD